MYLCKIIKKIYSFHAKHSQAGVIQLFVNTKDHGVSKFALDIEYQ